MCKSYTSMNLMSKNRYKIKAEKIDWINGKTIKEQVKCAKNKNWTSNREVFGAVSPPLIGGFSSRRSSILTIVGNCYLPLKNSSEAAGIIISPLDISISLRYQHQIISKITTTPSNSFSSIWSTKISSIQFSNNLEVQIRQRSEQEEDIENTYRTYPRF